MAEMTIKLQVKPSATLLQLLRGQLGLVGTKEGCGTGECGACTVIMDGKSVNSCLVLAVQANGKSIETVEGLAKDGELHLLQKSFIEKGAVQCGFCSPGMLMTAKNLVEKRDLASLTRGQIRSEISGNLCRCTGYQKIVDAIYSYAQEKNSPKEGDQSD